MKIVKLSKSDVTYTGWGNNCGGFKDPGKGEHLDTQLFPGCKRKKKKKKADEKKEVKKEAQNDKKFNLKKFKGL